MELKAFLKEPIVLVSRVHGRQMIFREPRSLPDIGSWGVLLAQLVMNVGMDLDTCSGKSFVDPDKIDEVVGSLNTELNRQLRMATIRKASTSAAK
jgi:hypothetical protein